MNNYLIHIQWFSGTFYISQHGYTYHIHIQTCFFFKYSLPVHWIITSFTFRYFSWHILYQCFKQPPHSLPDTSHDTLFISSLNNYLIHLQKLLMTYSVLVRWIFISFTSSSHATFCTSVLNNYLIYFQILFFKYSAPAMLFFEHLCHSHANTPFMSQSKLMLWAVTPFTFNYWSCHILYQCVDLFHQLLLNTFCGTLCTSA